MIDEPGYSSSPPIELYLKNNVTKLYNPRIFEQHLEKSVTEARRMGTVVSLLFLGINGYRGYVAERGEKAGIAALQNIALVIRQQKRTTDIPARYKGELLAIILPKTDEIQARVLAERVQRVIERFFVHPEIGLPTLTINVGIASYPDTATDKDELMGKASAALAKAKELGPNKIYTCSHR